ncbi:MAG: RecX family transcriptional regulator [candidate division WOR-3 bacterium]
MKITRIEEQRKKDRVNVYINGRFSFGLYKDTLINFHLYEGKEISEEEIVSIKEYEELVGAKEKARRYISYRERSKKEIENYLKNKGIQEGIINKVLSDFEKVGLIDDRRFALSWIKNRSNANPKGRFAIKMELLYKGVPENEMEDLLRSIDEKENARKAIEKAVRKYKGKPNKKEKVIEYLRRRGFEMSTLREVVKEFFRNGS